MMKGTRMEAISPNPLGEPVKESEVFRAFDNLVASECRTLADAFKADRVLLIVNDTERGTPTARMISYIDKYLKTKGQDLSSKRIDVIFATGSHPPPTEEGQRRLLGEYYEFFKPRIKVHRAKESEHEYIGSSIMGTPIRIDRQISGYDMVVPINSVEPHYFAGYTGGRKSLVPGISHFETIEKNHRHALDENSRTLSLKTNPVHLDMMDIAAKIVDHLRSLNSEVIAINCIASSGEIHGLSSGDIFKCWEALLPKTDELFTVKVQGRFDIVVAQACHPQNRKLYQALKAFENGKMAVREGGILILDAKCSEGIGPETFYNIMKSYPTPGEIIENIRKAYVLDAHKSTNVLAFIQRHKMYIVSELPDETVRNCYCSPFKTVDEALEAAVKELALENPRILKIIDANNVVPLVS